MASSSSDSDNNVPQWKRDLIRRRQGKVITSNCSGGGSASSSRESTCGAVVVTASFESSPVAGNMRLEADVSRCSDSEDVLNSVPGGRTSEINIEKSKSENCDLYRAKKVERKSDIFQLLELSKKTQQRLDMTREIKKVPDDCESDSSEELQYGPGIVNKLKSKYLNLTLRETNKNRGSVQRFRRAASLEDLLDCDDDPPEKMVKRFAKKNVVTKAERYRNSSRGNDSMKRARSVETLMRYNSAPEEPNSNRFGSIFKQEPVNDHIILIDRSSAKIESRLVEERPKAVNKPMRIKPVLAETERPPPDLVKTTMRIFEGSTKKLKPKGEVAAKVATFKTINDTFKAKNQKKIIPKPPLQPKPFLNGNNRTSCSPKKIILTQKPTIEVEKQETPGVITEPIVQSVSSVVSKFQQIEKSLSPSPSPEPSFKERVKFSPVPSPEPSLNKLKSSLEINVKSPPVTPVLSPRIQSPASPKKDIIRQNSSPVHKSSPSREFVKQISEPPKFWHQMEKENMKPEISTVTEESDNKEEIENIELRENEKSEDLELDDKEIKEIEETQENVTETDGPRTVSRSALDNISKAGTTLQFNFNNKSIIDKSHLPILAQNGQTNNEKLLLTTSEDLNNKTRIQERLNPEKIDKQKEDSSNDNRPMGAISSLGLIKTVTMTYPQSNESKTIRYHHKSEPPQKQIGIIRPLVSTKTQLPQQNLSNRELEKNLINRVKSIEQQPTKVVVSLKSAEEIQAKKSDSRSGLWDTKPWNQQNNTMVFNFSGRKDVPDYIENDGMNIKRKRDKPIVTEGGIIVLDATLDASTTDESDWEISGGPPSPCDVSFLNDNILINGRSNLSRQPRNHKHRIQFNDEATRTFEYPSEASMLEGDGSSVDGETSGSGEQFASNNARPSTSLPSLLEVSIKYRSLKSAKIPRAFVEFDPVKESLV
ncbi:uncharacterized protein LOC127285260 isoform X2 [Leptopilina boulardi]|uniref:uncharacterized protein LOC127285260 isoform X2 n=1 Tax=Leptopilina boulardi TaxID=63433 RepID=UPI0021F68545|nr:uncharacterized protein LOC127285260 isoform X2 [Leptopilina boulardi]